MFLRVLPAEVADHTAARWYVVARTTYSDGLGEAVLLARDPRDCAPSGEE